jgi:hypothetical protein
LAVFDFGDLRIKGESGMTVADGWCGATLGYARQCGQVPVDDG